MQKKDFIKNIADTLLDSSLLNNKYLPLHGKAIPSIKKLKEMVEIIKILIFPGYFDSLTLNPETLGYHIGINLDQVYHLLAEQVDRGICFNCRYILESDCVKCENKAYELSEIFINRLPEIRRKLSADVKAMFDGDPASKSFGEIIYCYPSIKAMINYRIAHELYKLSIPLIPRIITEMAHSETGIDIHPGADIGENFAIDHGTGVVIGETSVIGNNVKIYQGVTLGAKSFPLDNNGIPIKGIQRHPIVQDNVIIYSQATF